MSIKDPSDYKTGDAVPSNKAMDLNDNAKVFDVFQNSQIPSVKSRLGVDIKTVWQQEQDFIEASNKRDKAFDAQFMFKRVKSFADAHAAGEKITDLTRLNSYSTGAGDAVEWWGLIQSTTIPDDGLPIPSSPDENWALVSALSLYKLRSDLSSQLGLVYFNDWSSGIVIPDNSKLNKKSVWYNGQFYSVGTDTGFTSNDFDADLTSGKFKSALSVTIQTKIKPIPEAVGRTLSEISATVYHVDDYGALPDWNSVSKTGTDSTTAIQNTINIMSSTKNIRSGGKICLKFGSGSYYATSLTIPGDLIFGFDIVGEGRGCTSLFLNNPGGVGIDFKIGYIWIDAMTIFGVASEQDAQSTRCQSLIRVYPESKIPDCDISFGAVTLGHAVDIAELHGRGCTFSTNTVLIKSTNALNIVCDTDTIFAPSNPINTERTGMRHYKFDGCRTDDVSFLLTVSGTGNQRNYINDVQIKNTDLLSCNSMIYAPDAQFQLPTITGNNAIDSFNVAPVTAKAINGLVWDSNSFTKNIDISQKPTSADNSTDHLCVTTGALSNSTFTGGVSASISGDIIKCGAGSSNITIDGMVFLHLWEFLNTTAHRIINCDSAVPNLTITDNAMSSTRVEGAHGYYVTKVTQEDPVKFDNNDAIWTWINQTGTWTPTLFIGGVQVSLTKSAATYEIIGNKAVGSFAVEFTSIGGATGAIQLKGIPRFARALCPSVSADFAGSANISINSGFDFPNGDLLGPAQIGVSTQSIELLKSTKAGAAAVTHSDLSGSIVKLYGDFTYNISLK